MHFITPVYNADDTLNKNRSIKEFAMLQLAINDYYKHIDLTITELGNTDLFLEYDWLTKYNPEIDWGQGTVFFTKYSDSCSMSFKEIKAYLDVSEYLRRTNNNLTLVFTILSYFEEYKNVFSEESFE